MSEPPSQHPNPAPNSAQPAKPTETPRPQTVPEAAGETLAGDPALVPPAARSAPETTAPSASSDAAATVPQCASRHFPSLAGFEVLKELGRGGMGVVYLVRHLQMNRTEALKMILSGEHASSGDLARFQTEARTVASLHHNNFVQIYDVGESGGHPYLRLEYVNGGNLEEWLDRQLQQSCLLPRAAAQLVEHLARAMHHMHEKGMIHRDLKPANVLVQLPDEAADGTVRLEECELKISDFGLAREVRGPGAQTRGIIGTPAYMAPEQALGEKVDRRADVYALGAILYRLLTGKAPHDGDDPMSVLARLIQPGIDPVPPSQVRPDVSPALDAICRKALNKDRSRRQATARQLADDLKRFVETGEGPLSVPGDGAVSLTPSLVAASGSTARLRAAAAEIDGRLWRRIALTLSVGVVVALVGWSVYRMGRRPAAPDATAVAEVRQTDARHREEEEGTAALRSAKEAREKGDLTAALKHLTAAEGAYSKLHEADKDQPRYTLALARTHIDTGSVWLEYRIDGNAERCFATAIDLLTNQIPREAKTDDVSLALADAYHHRAERLNLALNWKSALAWFESARKIREGLYWKNGQDRAFLLELARSHGSIGHVQLQLGRFEKAREAYNEGFMLRRKLVSADPADDEARYQLAQSYRNLAKYAVWSGNLAPANKNYGEARAIYQSLTAAHPDDTRYKAALGDVSLWLAEVHIQQQKPGDVPDLLATAGTQFDALRREGRDEMPYHSGKFRAAATQARLQLLTSEKAAKEEAARAIDLWNELQKFSTRENRLPSDEDKYNLAAMRAIHDGPERAWSSLKSTINNNGFRNFERLRLDGAFQAMNRHPTVSKELEALRKEKQAADAESADDADAPPS